MVSIDVGLIDRMLLAVGQAVAEGSLNSLSELEAEISPFGHKVLGDPQLD